MARLLLGVSGGVAAYKALELVRLATAAGHAVRVVQTPASLRFVGRDSFSALTGAPVLVDQFEPDPARGAFPGDPVPGHAPISHLALVERADLLVVAPASANTLAKLAHGLADNLLTAAALAARCPVAVAPAMNDRMYGHPATRANLALLRERGVAVLEPGTGRLASHGEWGAGRLREPADLLVALEALLAVEAGRGPWAGLRVLVSAGGTREPIDAVRFIGNRSSGRMGLALAAEAAARGAEVTVLAANVSLPRPPGPRYVDVATAAELHAACRERFAGCDVLLMAAAVADFRPARPAAGKLRKEAGPPGPLELEATADILSSLAPLRRPGHTVVGFAAEEGDRASANARAKLERKRLDMVVLNDIARPGIGFDAADNEVTIITGAGAAAVGRADKRRVAAAVLDAVEALRARGGGDDGAVGAPAPDRAARV